MSDRAIRRAIIDQCLAMNRSGLNQGTSGNISVRHGAGMLITPTALPYEDMTPEDIVLVGPEGAEGPRAPSSEWRFHRDILATRADAGAVVHVHSPYATMLAILGRAIPPLHYMVAVAGGEDIRVADYALYGTQELSDAVLAALDGRKACLMAHHGMVALGATLDQAIWLAGEVEALARLYHGCLATGREPPLLTDAQMAAVLDRISGYGRTVR